MQINKVTFENFRPYYGNVTINLKTQLDKNLILIGGRNGQGKTSFLVGVVWCLYGVNISDVDKVYKDEVKGNYSKFLSKSLNKIAYNEGREIFSVEIEFCDVELSDIFTRAEQKLANITLKRSYNVVEPTNEIFEILIDGEPISLLSSDDDKINFVNDYLIPIDIAKFVFFDAEKIAEIAQLGAKDQASLMNKAFGQVLGLNVYEGLIEELVQYERSLQKEAASSNITQEIETLENEIRINNIKYDDAENKLNIIDERIEELKVQISDCNNQLIKRGDPSVKEDIDELKRIEQDLNEKLIETSSKFNELSDIIPLAILGYKIEEVYEQLLIEEKGKARKVDEKLFEEKSKNFVENLFNKPEYPSTDIDLEQKLFYYNKAKNLLKTFYDEDETSGVELFDFMHDLERSEFKHFEVVYSLVRQYSVDTFDALFSEYLRIQNDYQDVIKRIRLIESSNKDEFIQDIIDTKQSAEREINGLYEDVGRIKDEQIRLSDTNKELQRNITYLLSQVKISEKTESQIKDVKKYIKALEDFVREQKLFKKEILQETLMQELNMLMNKTELFDNVEINIHSNNLGLEVRLYDKNGDEAIPASDMSKGEQQLYVSALLKAILSESIYDLPVFIDTPLGRLDQEHRDNILRHYYPNLSNQVVIFSTNTEIRVSDLPKIENVISSKYLLENKNGKSIINSGYFE